MSITIRPATAADKDFLITAIIEAEKSGSDVISYCRIFGITEEALREMLGNILDEEMPGQELCIDSFLIAEEDGQPAATLAAWVEGAEGMSSSMVKSNLLVYYVGADAMLDAIPKVKLVANTNIERENGALQIESVYTAPQYRGRGLAQLLIEEQVKRWKAQGLTFDKAQVMLMGNNPSAQRAYSKLGFEVAKTKTQDDPEILYLLPGNTKLLMERKIN